MQMHIKQENPDLHSTPCSQPAPTELQNGQAGIQGYPGYPMVQGYPMPQQGVQPHIQQHMYQVAPYGGPANYYNGQQVPNPLTALQAQINNNNNKPTDTEPKKAKISDNQIDIESVKGKFGWTTLDGVNVPYIFRKDKKFVSVRIVEQKLLSRYPNSYPDELGKHQPLTSFFITEYEAKLLNEINIVHCGGEFGRRDFNSKDLIVLLTDFDDFYNLVKKTFPENDGSGIIQNQQSQSKIPNNVQSNEEPAEMCGWIQVNNTVTPFVKRDFEKFVPLSVMKYAAGLSLSEQGVLPTEEECSSLNKSCKLAGFNFNFSKTTRIISVSVITRQCSVHITPLPSVNPLQHACYLDLPNAASPAEQSQNANPSQPKHVLSQPKNAGQQQQYIETPQNMPAQNPQFVARPPPPYNGYGGSMPPRLQGVRGSDKQPPHENRNVHPAFTDPMRFMFSYNRFPFNMYPMQFGPPNVTVNPQQSGYNQMPMPPPGGYPQNAPPVSVAQANSGPQGLDNQKSRQSPASSSNSGNPGLQQQPPSQVNAQMMSTSPRYNNPQFLPGNQSHSSSQVRSPGYGVPVNPVQNYQNMQQYRIQPGNQTPQAVASEISQQNQKQQAQQQGMNWPYVSQPNTNSTDMLPGGNQTTGQTMLNVSPGRNIPPPPVMSGPHGPSPTHPSHMSSQSPAISENEKQTVSPVHLTAGPPINPQSANGNLSSGEVIDKSNVTTPKSSNPPLVDSIKGEWLVGKSISCMNLNNSQRTGKFCLVEAVCKLYFNGCSVNEFLFALENVLKIPLVTCTDEEEKAFIHYYSLPVTVLKCNKMINFEDLEKFFPQLSYVFRDKSGTSEPHKTLSQTNTTTSPNKNMPNTSNQSSVIITNNSTGTQGRTTTHHSRKRPTISPVGGAPNKVPCRRLEETVQRLRQQTVVGNTDMLPSQYDNAEADENQERISDGGTVIILDD